MHVCVKREKEGEKGGKRMIRTWQNDVKNV